MDAPSLFVFEVAGADIKLSLGGLREVRGRVLRKGDRHVPNNVVSIALSLDGDKGQPLSSSVDADGSFHFDYLSQGPYTLQVNASDFDQTEPPLGKEPDEMWQPRMMHRYALVRVPVLVAEHDVTVDDLLLVPSTANDDEGDEPR